MHESIDLSVVVPCYNAAETIGLQLDALARQRWSGSWEVIVADNGSRDASASIAAEHGKRIARFRLLDASGRRGSGHARNVGANAAFGDLLVFCDADDVVGPDWMGNMAAVLSKHRFAASRLECGTINPPWLLRARGNPQRDGVQVLSYPPYLPHASASGLGVWRSVHAGISGFDESLRYLVDTDYCIRVQLGGVILRFAADAVVHYRHRATPWGQFRQAHVWGKHNALIYRRYRPEGARVEKAWTHYVREWRHLLPRLRRIRRNNESRARLAYRLGWQLGLLEGSLRYRVPPVACPESSQSDSLPAGHPADSVAPVGVS